MWAAWTVLCLATAMLVGLKVGRPLYYSDGEQQVLGGELPGAGMLRWLRPEAEFELPGRLTGRVAKLPDGRLLYAVLSDGDGGGGEFGTSDLVTWDPEQPDVPPEPAYGLNTEHNELAPAVGPDGLIYFASDRPESIGGYDLFVTTLTARGFGAVTPVLACNTAFDETDPAPDPRGETLVFARIDRALDNGNDGVLWRWRLGDVLDPEPVFPEHSRRRDRVIDRDPVFAGDGASIWFVRQERGSDLVVCRSSRLGDKFDEPTRLVDSWGAGLDTLRSPIPFANGREVAFVQVLPAEPPRAEPPPADPTSAEQTSAEGQSAPPAEAPAKALVYLSTAEELVPWWPGQHWLEWLLLSCALCALLLLLLLYFGQRWSALDLVAQCLLLSLLLHALLFLWLMGVEIAGSLMPGSDDDDSGMQVSIVASAGLASASSSGGDGDVAQKVARTVRERAFDVQQPNTATARAQRASASELSSLDVESGAYEVAPSASEREAVRESAAPQLADAAAESAKRSGSDAAAAPAAVQLSAVQQQAQAADDVAQRSAQATTGADARVLEVRTPGSGLQRAAVRSVALASNDASQAMPLRTSPTQQGGSAGASSPELQDAPNASALAASSSGAADAEAAPVGLASEAALTEAPAAATVAAPQRGARSTSQPEQVAMPGSSMARSQGTQVPAGRSQRVAARAVPRRTAAAPRVELAGETGPAVGGAASPLAASSSSQPAPRASIGSLLPTSLAVDGPAAPARALAAERRATSGERRGLSRSLPTPGSSLRRPVASIAVRGPRLRQARGMASRSSSVKPVTLRGPGQASAVGQPTTGREPAGRGAIVAKSLQLPDQPNSQPSFAPRRSATRRSSTAGAFAERFPVAVPETRLARAVPRPTSLPRPTQPAVAQSAYSNRFGPAKAKALERFGGTKETERAVRDGLRYLAGIQNGNGSWGNQRDYDRKYGFVYVGKTALCVLAFLGAGHSPTSGTEYSKVVDRAVQHLLSVQEDDTGAFGRSSCYGHGIATYAIAECYGLMKGKPEGAQLEQPLEDALNWILANQGPRRDARNRGGWGYFSPGLRADDSYARVSVSSWMIMALESARMSGVILPDDVMPAAKQYLELSFDRRNGWFRYNHKPSRLRSGWPTLPASTPAGAFCMMLLGAEKDDRMVSAAVDYTVERRPQRYRRYRDDDFVLRGQGNVYFWYYGSLCCFLKGGEAWEQWNARLSTVLPAAQAEDGSFPPIDVYSEEAGDTRRDRSYTTAMCVLSLEVYYRYFTPLLLGR